MRSPPKRKLWLTESRLVQQADPRAGRGSESTFASRAIGAVQASPRMKISRNYDAEHLRNLDFTSEADWQRAITIFEDRLETRYLEHIRALLPRKTSGFVVLTLDCALIETLQQFRLGVRKTPDKEGKKYFVVFLTTTLFSQHFDEESAGLFYKTIRC